jgi:hypothetical protein
LHGAGFGKAELVLRHVGEQRVDMAALREQLKRDVYSSTIDELRDHAAKADELNLELTRMQAAKTLQGEITRELLAQYPSVQWISVADGASARRSVPPAADSAPSDAKVALVTATAPDPAAVTLVLVQAQPPLADADLERIRAYLGVRLQGAPLEVVQLPPPAPVKRRPRKS